ncbi:MAG TPA: response regulator [Oculatellaceae cyanobacterium]
MSISLGQLSVVKEPDIILARQCTKEIASFAGLSVQDQTRLVTAVSEIVRNAFQYAGGARLELGIIEDCDKQYVQVVIRDQGPGIASVEDILQGQYKSATGMGRGILGARRLVDLFSIESQAGAGTSVSLGKAIPSSTGPIVVSADVASHWTERLRKVSPGNLLQEIQEQNQQLLQTIAEAQNYKEALERQLLNVQQLNDELDQTNTGIMALYKELDESKTELLKKTEMLESQSKQLQDASRHKSEFLAHMSHEIRTPMNGVLGMTEVLLKSGLTEKQHAYAATIQEAGRSLLSVINDVLDFSKIEAGKLSLEVIDFEPVRLVEDIAELLAPQAKQNGLSLLTFVDPEISLILGGDPVRLRQILMNLAGNAIKFSEHGSILIRAVLESKDTQRARIKFSVTDPGTGLTEQEITKLFEPFVQSDSSTSRKYGGTGLGLSISKRLVELMDGTIGVNSVKGHGSTFWFTVPLEIGSSECIKHLSTEDLASSRVLIVDDDAHACEIIHTYLASWGLRYTIAEDAQRALAILRTAAKTDPFQIAIVDLVMPGTDGLQLGKAIREDDYLKNIKLIMITAFDKPGIGEEAIQLGFDAYLTKPMRQSQLLNAITTLAYEAPSGKNKAETEQNAETDAASSQDQLTRMELILVAEDHPVNQQVALLFLKNLGFEAHIADNGLQVLEKMQLTTYSLVFMDCQMPKMDGFEATRRIRKTETLSGSHIPIVAMTANAIEGSREQCLAAGMDDYVSKPISPEQLQTVLKKWLPIKEIASTSGENV